MYRSKLSLVLLFVTVISCQSSNIVSKEAGLLGRWMMEQVIQSGEDVTARHNPENNRWIEFSSDGSFTSDGSVGRNTGRWSIDASGTLFIDSDAGEEDDSSWSVSLESSKMTWKGRGSDFARGFVLVHKRVDSE